MSCNSVVLLAGPDGLPRTARANASARFEGQVYDTKDPEQVIPGSAAQVLNLTLYEPDMITVIGAPDRDILAYIDPITGDIDYVLSPEDVPLIGDPQCELHYIELTYQWTDGTNTLTGIQMYSFNVQGTLVPADTLSGTPGWVG